jgi:hypothetical protein
LPNVVPARGGDKRFSVVCSGHDGRMDAGRAAELQVLLEGVTLPAHKDDLLEYAVRQRAEPAFLDALQQIPDRDYESIDQVAEELLHMQPPPPPEAPPHPREESGDPPGGDAYTDPDPEPGRVRDADRAPDD